MLLPCSVAKLCLTLCNPMDGSTLGFPVLHYLPGFAQIHVHWVVVLFNHLIFCHPLLLFLQSFTASGYFLMSWLFTSGGQSIGTSASASVLLMNIQDWFPLNWLVWSPCSLRDSQVFFIPVIWEYQFFSAQPSLWSNSLIHTWLLEKQ